MKNVDYMENVWYNGKQFEHAKRNSLIERASLLAEFWKDISFYRADAEWKHACNIERN